MRLDVRLCLRVPLAPDMAIGLLPEAVDVLASTATLVMADAATISDRGAVAALRALRSALPAELPILAVGRVDLALAAGLDGVMLHPSDLTPGDARRLLGPAGNVGVGIDEPAQADELYRWRAEFACIGAPATEVVGKPRPPSPEHLSRTAFRVRLASPGTAVVAIVDSALVPERLIGAGANGFCVVSAGGLLADAPAARDLRSRIEAALPRSASA